ncbi:MAG: PQQ-binding-like beta-propeller repeat protein, partial [Planctomycetes bacterium]|nr:PQQ-binding-like beta-propeller repeat protein [Planctomycetota bacterium]
AIVGKAIQSQGPDVNAERLKQWAADTAAENTTSHLDDMGTWVQFDKPAMAGADDWSHWEKGPDNNPVSRDQVIRAPYMTQFMAKPFYIGMPSVTTASDGRTFLAIGHIAHHRREWNMLNKLVARNGYNGTILWERKFPEGYLVHRSAFIATPDTFYMIDGDSCLMLDPQTGKEQGRIHVPGAKGEWKWMAMKDNVLYVMSGKPSPLVQTTKGDRTFGGWSWADLSRGYYGKSGDYRREDIPWGFGDTIVAYDIEAKRALWLHKEEHLIDSRSLAMVDDKLFLLCPGKHLRCVDRNTGKEIWTNQDRKVSDLIKQPGERLTSTPGFKTQTVVVATPKALIIQGQTRQNVVAVSTEDGYLLWTKRKFTNNPNAIFVDGKVILGVGQGGTHVVIDPVSGKEEENLGFRKTACTRLTAVGDSFFCRGEGTLRYDRKTKKVLVDGAQRPACNDGALPANGLLYLGPWQCDCNLSLIGCIAKCSAGDFRFDLAAEDRLYLAVDDLKLVKPLEISKNDWPTYRGNNHRSSSSPVAVSPKSARKWQATPKLNVTPTAPISAGGLVFVAGDDGKVRAIDSASGDLRWQFATAGPIKFPPSISEGRAYFGSADGHAYCVEAATGRLLWRFRAAPVERHIMVYDHLSSTWPVASGVLVHDGVAYFAAGIIDQDGTYVYAVEATSGKL